MKMKTKSITAANSTANATANKTVLAAVSTTVSTTLSTANAKAATMALQVAIYARVSSDQQAQEQTIESQVAALRERVRADGQTLPDELCFRDEGWSGSTLVRPALERLRDLAYVGGLQKLYVLAPDRLARKYAYQVLLIEEFQKHHVEVVFLNTTMGVSPEEDLLLQVQGMFAEYERAKILERSRRGKRHAASRGSVAVLSGAPYGFRYVGKREGPAAYEIHPSQGPVIKTLFEWVGYDRCSLGEVCRRLQTQAILSPTGKTRWDRSTVWGLLRNSAFRGAAVFGKTRNGPRREVRPARGRTSPSSRVSSSYPTTSDQQITISVPAIVSDELFAAVQQQLDQNRAQARERARGPRYLLQGLLKCSCCGYAYHGTTASGKVPYTYYRCGGNHHSRHDGVCRNTQVRLDKLDAAIWQDACELLRHPQLLRQEYQRRLAAPEQAAQDALHKQIATAQRTVNRLIDAFTEGVLTREEFAPRLDRARQRLSALQAQQVQVQSHTREQAALHEALACLDQFTETMTTHLDQADWPTRREILHKLIDHVLIEPEQIRIVYRINFPLFAKRTTNHFAIRTPPQTGQTEKVLQFRWRRGRAAPPVATILRSSGAKERANSSSWSFGESTPLVTGHFQFVGLGCRVFRSSYWDY